MKNILEKFEETVQKFPNKALFLEVNKQITFLEFKIKCQILATHIAKRNLFNRPIAVIDNRDINTLVAMFGVVYSGNHYVVLDGTSPAERLKKICQVVEPALVLCQSKQMDLAAELNAAEVVNIDNILNVNNIMNENNVLNAENFVNISKANAENFVNISKANAENFNGSNISKINAEKVAKVSKVEKVANVSKVEKVANVSKMASVVNVSNINNIQNDVKISNVLQQNEKIDYALLESIRQRTTAHDLVYILFTSGSTGVPKGTVITHANLLSYVEWFATTFKIDQNTIFGSQTSFYFSASVSDIFSSVMYGASLNIIPKSYFAFPIQLVRFLNERKVNIIYWVPSALVIVANLKTFDYESPEHLKKVLFAGEIMPNKQLNYWRKNLPDVMFANLFGPTETTDICTYYVVDRPFKDEDSLPIGRHCNNAHTFVLDENLNEITEPNKPGELYVSGPFVANGYYNNPEATKNAFVQNPLNSKYPEIVYKTGDLVMLNFLGGGVEYNYLGRTDFQIKHKGYRIELGEIERVATAIEKVDTVAAIFDKEEDKIIAVYTGRIKKEDFYSALSTRLPNYMLPEILIKLPTMPYNQNGKIDRKQLLATYKSLV